MFNLETGPDRATRTDSAIRLSCARIAATESGQVDPTSAHTFTHVLDERPNPVIGLQELVFPRLLSSRNRRCMERSVYAPVHGADLRCRQNQI
jgi:hypothetical protein